MIRFLKQLIVKYSNKNLSHKFSVSNLFNYQKGWKMASDNIKTKSHLDLEHLPVKKMKLDGDVSPEVEKRTVATMCGAWRGEEEDGGMVLVFKTRQPCLSPDPTKESDYPENIEDFWIASLSGTDDDQFKENVELCDCGALQSMDHLLSCPSCPTSCTIDDLNEANDRGIAVATYWSNII